MPRRRRLTSGRARIVDILNDFYDSGATRDDFDLVLVALERHYKPSKRGNPHGNPRPKKRRKTAYQSAYSAAYKRLKKKHPRMSFGSLSKKAHAAARKKVK